MLITNWDEQMRRTMVIGCGRVVARDGQSPLQKTVTTGTSRIGFSVCTGTIYYPQTEKRAYQTMPCGVYIGFYGRELYEIATTLKKNDFVFFCGWLHEGTYIDQATGKTKESKECRIEFLCPIKLVHKMLFWGTDSKKKKADEKDIPTKINVDGIDDGDLMF